MIRRRWRGIVIAVCLAGAIAFGLLAVELVRWQRQIARGDALFPVTPERAQLWQVPGAPAWDPARSILGLDHALSYRQALKLFWSARPVSQYVASSVTPAQTAEAQTALQAVADADPDPRERATVLNILGVVQLDENSQPHDPAGFRNYVQGAIADFTSAVTLDGDPDAKLNLELALALLKEGLDQFFGHGPIGGRGGGTSAGVGLPGSGY